MANFSKIINDIVTSTKLEKFFESLNHADLPTGWQNDKAIVDAAGKLYQKVGTNSPFFKAWFGDSVAQNAKGKPIKFYHGTDSAPFDVFNTKGDGAFFSNNRYIARTYGPGNITKAYLKTENPLMVAGNEKNWSALNPELDYHIPKENDYGKLKDYLPEPRTDDIFYTTKDIPIMSREKGHDGVYFENINDIGPYSPYREGDDDRVSDVVSVFSPTQIKSVNNRGTFDPSDPNILRTAAPWLAGGGLAAGAVLGGGEAQATPRLSPDLAAWAKSAEKSQALQEPVWSPSDLFMAPIGAAGIPAKAAAMALDAPVSMALNEVLDYINSGATAVADWWRR